MSGEQNQFFQRLAGSSTVCAMKTKISGFCYQSKKGGDCCEILKTKHVGLVMQLGIKIIYFKLKNGKSSSVTVIFYTGGKGGFSLGHSS